MEGMRHKIARITIQHRKASWLVFIAITAFFAVGLRNVEIKTIFSDLLPKDDPFVQVFKDHPNFGNPLTVTMMVKRKNGDIYNAETLGKVWQLTRDIDLAPGVDHDQILSIASEKARYAEATPFGIDMRPLMEDSVPSTPEEIQNFRERVQNSPNARTFMISNDGTATLVSATFIEARLDYGEAFKYVQDLAHKATDEHHEIFVAGQPTLTGWVYHYQSQVLWIAMLTIGALIVALMLYMRNIVGVVTPIVTSGVAAIWGFGLVGWLKLPVEPLLMVVPLLLVARSFSHSVQFTERYYEVLEHVPDRLKAAEITMRIMMAPSVLGIITDTVGVFLIAVAPIPAMERFAFFCGFWCIWLIPTGVVLISLLLASLPQPKNIDHLIGHGENTGGMIRRFKAFLSGIASLSYGPRARITTVIVAIGSVVAFYLSSQIPIGNPVEGSNLLWPASEYNTAVTEINQNFPGVNTLELVLEAKDPKNPSRVARQADTVVAMQQLQALIEKGENPPRASLSFADYLMEGNRLFAGGNPKWLPLDPENAATNAAASAVLMGSSPKAYSHIVDFDQQNSTVSLWYADNKQATVDGALATAKKAVEQVGIDHPAFTVRLGTGTIALQQAMNVVVERYHWLIFGLLNLAVFIATAFAYRSVIAGVFLLIPVNLSNFVMTAAMNLLGIGIDINSVLVACVGVGVGIDYGIYLLSRICEEFQAHPGDWGRAIDTSLTTTGKAIMFTATIMVIGILPWYFLSGLKFMADMGLLLVCIMMINMVLALIVLPLLIWLFKPGFVSDKDLIVLGEGAEVAELAAQAQRLKAAEANPMQSPPCSALGGSPNAPAVAGG